jgi:hypothetical protein
VSAERRAGAVGRQLDELELVRNAQLARKIREEDDARLQRRDQKRLGFAVVVGDLARQLGDALGDLLGGEVAVADDWVAG